MAEKISKLAIKVDLHCHRCYKKIQKTLCELQAREKIKTISYDEKSNTVTISGPFDPQKLSKKLRCKACKVIKDIQIIVDPPPKDTKKTTEKDAKEEEGTKAKGGGKTTKKGPTLEPCEVINDIKIIVDLPKDPKCPEKNPDTKLLADPVPESKPKLAPCHPPIWPACCRIPYCVPYPGGSQCCSCGKVYGCVADGPPMMAYSGSSHGEYKVCQFVYEEDPLVSCTIM